jgi:hypothetical protein
MFTRTSGRDERLTCVSLCQRLASGELLHSRCQCRSIVFLNPISTRSVKKSSLVFNASAAQITKEWEGLNRLTGLFSEVAITISYVPVVWSVHGFAYGIDGEVDR